MPKQLDEDAWADLIRNEHDPFRLTIRGCAAIEADVDAYAEEMFRAPVPGGMAGLGPFSRRLPVAAALGVVPSDLVGALQKLWKLRNEYAHGDLLDLPAERIAVVQQAYEATGWVTPAAQRMLDRGANNPAFVLASLLTITRVAILVAVEFLRRERDEPARARALRDAIVDRLQRDPPAAPAAES